MSTEEKVFDPAEHLNNPVPTAKYKLRMPKSWYGTVYHMLRGSSTLDFLSSKIIAEVRIERGYLDFAILALYNDLIKIQQCEPKLAQMIKQWYHNTWNSSNSSDTLALAENNITIDKTSDFYKNCVRNRKRETLPKCCQSCPFKAAIEHAESMHENP
jgi:hypothetical protein